jgi:hypothetical protein
MAISFDESNDYYVMTDASELTLQDGDWCVGIWTYVTDNAGSAAQYVISNNNYSVNGSFNLWLGEASHATGTYQNEWGFNVEDDDGTNPNDVLSTSDPGADSTWRLVLVQRVTADNEIQLWFCELGGTASEEATGSDAAFAAVNGGNWNVGRRVDGDADRYYGSVACEFFKGDFSLSQDEITMLGSGLSIVRLGYSPDVYWPMFTADATLPDWSGNGNSGARQDAPSSVDHMPMGPHFGFSTWGLAAVAGGNPWYAYAQQ